MKSDFEYKLDTPEGCFFLIAEESLLTCLSLVLLAALTQLLFKDITFLLWLESTSLAFYSFSSSSPL